MDNHIFRSSALGFNRQDVMEYIEKTQKEAETNAASLSSQLDEALSKVAYLRLRLEESTGETERLTRELEASRRQYGEEHEARAVLERNTAQQSESIKALTEERDQLAARVSDLTGQSNALRQEKEKLAQLELDAHRRADELLAQTQAEADLRLAEAKDRAEGLINAANTQASDTIAQAEARREALLTDAQEQVEDTVRHCGELLETFEKISSSIAGELRKLSTTNGRLPVQLNGLKGGLAERQKKAGER